MRCWLLIGAELNVSRLMDYSLSQGTMFYLPDPTMYSDGAWIIFQGNVYVCATVALIDAP